MAQEREEIGKKKKAPGGTVSTIPERVKKNERYYCGDYFFLVVFVFRCPITRH